MNSTRVCNWTFFLSLACHAAFIFFIPGFGKFVPSSAEPLAVTFVRVPQPLPEVTPHAVRNELKQQETSPASPPKAAPHTAKKETSRPRVDTPRDPQPVSRSPAQEQPFPAAALPAAAPVLADNDALAGMYTNYYKIINDRLQRAASPPAEFVEGEITVLFVVRADGSLGNVAVVSDASSANSTLQQTAMQIVRNASPFPPFPRDLQRVDLTFNVVIYFRERS